MNDTNNNPNSKVDPQDELRDLIKIQPEEVCENPEGEQSYLDGDENWFADQAWHDAQEYPEW